MARPDPAPPVAALRDIAFAWPGQDGPSLRVDHFVVSAGEHVFISGASGSGKSTLLGLLAGVLTPGQGRVEVNGTDLTALSGARRDRLRADHIGIIFQQLNLLAYLSVLDNVLLGCKFSAHRRQRSVAQGGSPAEAAGMLLARLDLPESLWHRPAARLSVGQQQRVAAARALLGRPELVLADEPTSALDADRQSAFMDLLQRECRAVGASLVFVSHDTRLMPRFDRHLAMPHGFVAAPA